MIERFERRLGRASAKTQRGSKREQSWVSASLDPTYEKTHSEFSDLDHTALRPRPARISALSRGLYPVTSEHNANPTWRDLFDDVLRADGFE